MAKNLSERLLDMVEDDPRFTDLSAATAIVWLKLVRLYHRAATRRADGPGHSYGFRETARFLRVTEDELREHLVLLVSRGLLGEDDDKVFAPPECRAVAPSRPPRVVANRFVPQLVPMVRR